MSQPPERDNAPIYRSQKKHYEVWYLKFNQAPHAFWLRYTLLIPDHGLGGEVGELWAVAFDRDQPSWNGAWKQTFPLARCALRKDPVRVRIGDAVFEHKRAHGAIEREGGPGISWELSFAGQSPSFRHFPHRLLYHLPLPKTKVLAPRLSMAVSGWIQVGERRFELNAAPGHQAHLWGTQHARRWAWANCNAFRSAPGVVFEALSARVALAGRESPDLTIAALRLEDGRELRFNRMRSWLSNRAAYSLRDGHILAEQGEWLLDARIRNRIEDMVGVGYQDPDGSRRVCHNTKVADLDLELYRRESGKRWRVARRLEARGTCAYEVVRPEGDPRVVVRI